MHDLRVFRYTNRVDVKGEYYNSKTKEQRIFKTNKAGDEK